MAASVNQWRDLAEKIVNTAGFDLEDFSVVDAGRRRMVRVMVDSDTGVDLDQAAAVSRELSTAFDAYEQDGTADFGPSYTLEVTSPGIGRPLTKPRHFHRARGRLISLVTADGQALTVRLLGLADGTGAGAGIDVITDSAKQQFVAFDAIAKAKVEVDFSGPSAAIKAILAADQRTAAVLAAGQAAADLDVPEETDTEGTDTEERDTEAP